MHLTNVHLVGGCLMGVNLMGGCLMGVHLTGVHLMGVHLRGTLGHFAMGGMLQSVTNLVCNRSHTSEPYQAASETQKRLASHSRHACVRS